jgi:hypothetical protein
VPQRSGTPGLKSSVSDRGAITRDGLPSYDRGGSRSEDALAFEAAPRARRCERRSRGLPHNIRISCGPPPKPESPGLEPDSQI